MNQLYLPHDDGPQMASRGPVDHATQLPWRVGSNGRETFVL
jgi:hypothetical protein